MTGEELKKILKLNDVNQTELANKLGLSPQALRSRLQTKNVNEEFYRKIESVLGFRLKKDISVAGDQQPPSDGSLSTIQALTEMLRMSEQRYNTLLKDYNDMKTEYESQVKGLQNALMEAISKMPVVPVEYQSVKSPEEFKKDLLVG